MPLVGKRKLDERKKRIASAYQVWIDKIQTASNDQLSEILKPKNMVIDRGIFTS